VQRAAEADARYGNTAKAFDNTEAAVLASKNYDDHLAGLQGLARLSRLFEN
jgi:hypothetical protein